MSKEISTSKDYKTNNRDPFYLTYAINDVLGLVGVLYRGY